MKIKSLLRFKLEISMETVEDLRAPPHALPVSTVVSLNCQDEKISWITIFCS